MFGDVQECVISKTATKILYFIDRIFKLQTSNVRYCKVCYKYQQSNSQQNIDRNREFDYFVQVAPKNQTQILQILVYSGYEKFEKFCCRFAPQNMLPWSSSKAQSIVTFIVGFVHGPVFE
eukprot:TRINITY_DN18975_c0_g2_i3.p6 TRINITY_DN18975_c0_g2~~TRINITY_DN18975_c0_g2_i3.p6  ORF type:complete len:120 (+),score=0.91 TRINITY_DN18975_c0_g2_i3:171-530(+)